MGDDTPKDLTASANVPPASPASISARGDGLPVTHEQALAWLTGCAVALVVAALTFGGSVVGRAEAAAQAVTSPLERQLEGVERKIDRVDGKVDELLKRGSAPVKP